MNNPLNKVVVWDVLKSYCGGFISGGAIAFLVALVSWCFLADFSAALVIGQRIPLVLGATGLLIFSGFTLSRGGMRPLKHAKQWKRMFPGIQYGTALLMASAGLLSSAMLLDYLVFALRS